MEELAFRPFGRMLCGSRILQDRYVRRHRRSVKTSQRLDGATLGLAATAVGLGTFGAGLPAIAGVGLAGGSVGAVRSYKSPSARQALYMRAETALICLDAMLREASPLYAEDFEAADDFRFGPRSEFANVELAALAIQNGNLPLDHQLRKAADAMISLARIYRRGPYLMDAAYLRVGQTIGAAYQNTRQSVDYIATLNRLKTEAGSAQNSNDAAKGASMAVAVTVQSNHTTNVVNEIIIEIGEGKQTKAVRPTDFIKYLSPRYDTIRNMEVGIAFCEAIAVS